MAKTRHNQNQTLKYQQLLFADEQIIIADIEDNLQKAAHKLNQIITEYGLTIDFMVTPCINNIQHFNFQLMHTTLKNVEF